MPGAQSLAKPLPKLWKEGYFGFKLVYLIPSFLFSHLCLQENPGRPHCLPRNLYHQHLHHPHPQSLPATAAANKTNGRSRRQKETI